MIDSELKRRVDALRRPLELAAADNFAGVARVKGLGNVLRIACDQVIAKIAGQGVVDGLASWRATLERWEALDETQQAIEVARGMRLLARIPRPAGASIERSRAGATSAERSGAPVERTAGSIALRGERSQQGAPVERAIGPSGRSAPVERNTGSIALPGERPATRAGASRATSSPVATVPHANAAAMSKPRAQRAKPPAFADAAATRGDVEPRVARDGAEPRAKPADAAAIRDGAEPRAKPASSPTGATARPRAQRAIDAALDPLALPTHSLPGIGPAFAERLAEKGLATVEDLLWTLPRRYDDVRDARPLAAALEAPEGERVTFVARVATSRMIFARGRRWGEVRLVGLADAATTVVRWFNIFAGIDKRMPPGAQVVLSGVVKHRNGKAELANPDILGIALPDGDPGKAAKPPPAILARYPDVPGVPGARLRQACMIACERVGPSVDDGVPAAIERAAKLPTLFETLSRLHAPMPDITALELAAMNRGDSQWQRRLAFGELFALGVAIGMRRRERRSDVAVPCATVDDLDASLGAALPFQLTGAQRRSIGELAEDLARDVPMNRLLQGDVGAGKTAVAFAAALQVARAGRQTAVMAPTELLAEQHYQTWRGWAAALGIRIELLTASTPKGVRASTIALLSAGQLDVLIGTHALLAEGVGFGALGLVVIDEQHRFGVAQRSKLRDKGDGQGAPHLLVMTATPIPRTLALTAYGDLDVSVLDELPPGRQPIATKLLVGARGRAAAYKLVGERVAAGERAYIVCPKIEPSEDAEDSAGPKRTWRDAVSTAAEVAAALPAAKVGLVHGRLEGAERDAIMRAFKSGELDVLVATTVIEVGVDVPAATVMVVHDAERFGLAQLHQLRGRVGRGSAAAHCVLLAQGALGEDGEQRLAVLTATTDGFRIAEEDLVLRGPGEVFGPRQAGVPRLRFGDLHQHTQLLLEARTHAEQLLVEDPDLVRPEHATLRAAVARRLAHHVYGSDSG